MNKRSFWIAVILLGLVPFVLPFVSGLYHVYLESWTMFDWVVMYSVIYWPTYLIGLLVIPVALYQYLRQI